jgi:hypothetical protein
VMPALKPQSSAWIIGRSGGCAVSMEPWVDTENPSKTSAQEMTHQLKRPPYDLAVNSSLTPDPAERIVLDKADYSRVGQR